MNFINISLDLGDRQVDLRIPRQLTVKQLGQELQQIFGLPNMQAGIQLLVTNKGILLSEGALLANYPITTGDCLRIEELS